MLDDSRWVLGSPQVEKPAIRLFCLPYAGGGAEVFVAWRAYLAEEIELCPIQLPGRGSRMLDPAVSDRALLVTQMVDAIADHLDSPYALFGHSMGALLAFEFCREVAARKLPLPVNLLVSAERAPQLPNPDEPISSLPDAAFLQAVQAKNGPVLEAGDELLEMLLPALRADFSICEHYTCQADDKLDCQITALGGLDDTSVPWESLLGWEAWSHKAFACRMIDGDHFFLLNRAQETVMVINEVLTSTKS